VTVLGRSKGTGDHGLDDRRLVADRGSDLTNERGTSMREHTRRLLPVAVASVRVAAPASAGSHEVAVGGSDSGSDHPVTATSIASPQWVYETQSGSSLSTGCSSTRLD
jgi:hypothetical protein